MRTFVPHDHYLIEVIKDQNYKKPLEQLVSLRNFAAHNSKQSKNAALQAIGQKNLASSGAWLKRQDRLQKLVDKLKDMAIEIYQEAPY